MWYLPFARFKLLVCSVGRTVILSNNPEVVAWLQHVVWVVVDIKHHNTARGSGRVLDKFVATICTQKKEIWYRHSKALRLHVLENPSNA